MSCLDLYFTGMDWTWLGTSEDVDAVFVRLLQVLSALVQVVRYLLHIY